MFKFATAMTAYALALVGIGWMAYSARYPGASAWTSIVVPGLGAAAAITCVVLAARINSNRRLGMIGIHAGMFIPLLMAVGAFWRMPGQFEKNANFFNQMNKTEGVSTSTMTAEKHPTGYAAVGLGSVGALSSFAFVCILLLRPKPVAAAPEAAVAPASSNDTSSPPVTT